MKRYFALKTDKNYYLYVLGERNRLLPIDTYLYQIIQLYADGNNWEHLVDDEDLGKRAGFANAIKKFELFQKYGFFDDMKKSSFSSNGYTENDIRSTFSDINEIVFEVTDKCNLNCDYCAFGKYYSSYDDRISTMMSFDMAKRTIDFVLEQSQGEFPHSYKKKIDIGFYGGEPLLNFKLIQEIVHYLKNHAIGFDFTYSMTTNGLLLKKHIDFLKQHDFRIDVSLDGNVENNSYRVFHNGKSSHNQVVDNVNFVRDNYPDYFNEKIGFISVMHNRNSVEDVDQYISKNYDVPCVLTELSPLGIREEMQAEFMEVYSNLSNSFSKLYDCPSTKLSLKIFAEDPNYKTFLYEMVSRSEYNFNSFTDFYIRGSKPIPTGTCIPFQKRLYVTVNGKFMPCESVGNKFVFGCVNESGVEVDYQEIANSFNAYLDKFKRQCSGCYMNETCTECLYTILDYSESGHCRQYMGYSAYKDYLNILLREMEEHNSKRLIESV